MLGSLALVRQLVSKENSEFKPVKLRLKITYPARAEGLVNMITRESDKFPSSDFSLFFVFVNVSYKWLGADSSEINPYNSFKRTDGQAGLFFINPRVKLLWPCQYEASTDFSQ